MPDFAFNSRCVNSVYLSLLAFSKLNSDRWGAFACMLGVDSSLVLEGFFSKDLPHGTD